MAVKKESIEFLVSLYKNSGRQLGVTDKDMNLLWSNCDVLREKVIKRENEYTVSISDGTDNDKNKFNVVFEKLTLDDEEVYLLKLPELSDMFNIMSTDGYHKIYSIYTGVLKDSVFSFIGLCDMIDLPQAKRNDIFIKSKNMLLKIYSNMNNMDELQRYLMANSIREYIHLKSFLEDYLDDVLLMSRMNGFGFEYELDKSAIIETNAVRLICIIANLIANALEYNTNDEKKARLSVTADDEYVTIAVSDNGDGIEDFILEKTKVPFSMISTNYAMPNESLGLYLVRLFAAEYGGWCEFENKKEGFEARVILPNKKDEAPEDLETRPEHTYGALYKKHYTILGKAFTRIPDL